MGAAESALNNLTGDSEEIRKAKDMVKLTYAEVEAENFAFYEEVLHSNIESQRVIPVSAVLSKKFLIKICTSEDVQTLLKNGVNTVVEQFSNSNISGAISNFVNTALASLLTNRSTTYSRKIGYSLSIGKLGGVERVDFLVAKRSFTSYGWKNKMESVVSGVMVVSSCDIRKLKPNDASVLVQNCFRNSSLRVQAGIKHMLTISLDQHLSAKQKRDKQTNIIQDLKVRFEEQEHARKIKNEAKIKLFEQFQQSNQKAQEEKAKEEQANVMKNAFTNMIKTNETAKKANLPGEDKEIPNISLGHSAELLKIPEYREMLDLIKIRSIVNDASETKFDSLGDFLEKKSREFGPNFEISFEQGCLLSTALMSMVNFLIKKSQYSYASYALWTAYRLNPNNIECTILLQKIGLFTPLNLDDITVNLTVYFMKI